MEEGGRRVGDIGGGAEAEMGGGENERCFCLTDSKVKTYLFCCSD